MHACMVKSSRGQVHARMAILYIASSLLARSVYNGQGPDHYHYIYRGPPNNQFVVHVTLPCNDYLPCRQPKYTFQYTIHIYMAMHS